MKICAIIPACNEVETVGEIVRQTKEYVTDIFVVDNCSNDETAEVARQNGARIIPHPDKRGYGAAQYAGHMFAIHEGYDYILQLDADGQHDPKYIPKLLEAMQNGDYDIVLGSRFLTGSYKNLSFVRTIGIIFFSRVVSFLGHTTITDVTSGFKIYKVSSLQLLSKPSDINPAVEQMMEIAKKGMKIGEVPIEMLARNASTSHLNLGRFAMYPFRGLWAVAKVMLFR